MKAKWIKDIQYFEELSSTQDYALDLARQGAQGGTLVLAQRQTKGRGRKMNSWFSPAGGLWFSLILRPGMVPLYIPTLNLGMGLAVVRGVKKITGIPASLHWPNDIYCRVGLDDSEKKLGGILVEMEAKGDFLEFVAIGVGLNTNINLDDFPSVIRERTASVKNEIGHPIDNFSLLEEILNEFERIYAVFKRDGFKPILKDIKENCSLLGRRVSISDGEERSNRSSREPTFGNSEGIAGWPIEGQSLDIDESGALLVRLDSGVVTRILSGRVEVIR